jgi:hypothetical protein
MQQMKLLFTEKHIVNLLSTENSDACLKQTLDQASMKQKTSTGSLGNWTTMTKVS